ncbi:MAG: hypothetical protein ABEJ81_08585 [Haloferacaceae archaeon]
MPELMIRCPNTDEVVTTGIRASRDSLEEVDSYSTNTYIDKYNMLTDCPACGETHVWHAEDAFLEDEEDASGSDDDGATDAASE